MYASRTTLEEGSSKGFEAVRMWITVTSLLFNHSLRLILCRIVKRSLAQALSCSSIERIAPIFEDDILKTGSKHGYDVQHVERLKCTQYELEIQTESSAPF